MGLLWSPFHSYLTSFPGPSAHPAPETPSAHRPLSDDLAEVGVDEWRTRLLPEDKVREVVKLREAHGVVAMLGDGVNDAPALAAATVGFDMGAAGSPATIETADVALMADDLTKLPYAVRLARRARRTIRFNIALALGLKGILAVGAILGLLGLSVAVLVGDMGGSLVVTLNALRLARTQG